ncbi:DUF2304 family protein [Candidatus Gracilibacteria bacterium]|nr:DUF2304 family protein [Candidatus Gracilibacteria bacterium]
MTLLEIFFIISGFIIFFLGLDIARKEKFNALHFFVFLIIGGGLLIFTIFPEVLEVLGIIFGLQRGADVLVYGAIIFLIYMSLLLLSKSERNTHNMTILIRELSISNSSQITYTDELVILVRVYNESQVLSGVLNELYDSGYTNIIIIDDGSDDGSTEIIENFKIKNNHIISLRHSQNRGGGAALVTGFKYIEKYLDVENIVTFDADGQHRVCEIQKFCDIAQSKKEVEVFFGSRFIDGSGYDNMPIFRKYVLCLGRVFTYLMNGSRLSDPHNGFRLIRKSVLKDMSISSDGMAYASELVESVMKKKISHVEVPVHINYSDYSIKKGQKSSNAIFIGFRIIWNKFFQ